MPTFTNGSATLHYETWGSGPPILMLAPGGLRASRIETWSVAPWNPIEALEDRYFVVGMDQRNTGTSTAPIAATDGWHSYASDQIALMDHLGIERFAVAGMCIGGAFIMQLLSEVPDRITAAVAFQPIGLDGNKDAFRSIFEDWRKEISDSHPEASDADWEGVWSNLFGGGHHLWSASDAAIAEFATPILVLQGADQFHPTSASRKLAATAPNATLVEAWKEPADQPAARATVDEFLAANAA